MKSTTRTLLGSVASLALLAPSLLASFLLWPAGCGDDFTPASEITSLRILNVAADQSYPQPGETVTLTMNFERAPEAPNEDLQVLWLGGCFNPPGDEYYGCYGQIAQALQATQAKSKPSTDVAFRSTMLDGDVLSDDFKLTLPESWIRDRPAAQAGPSFATAFVFFALCAGELRINEAATGSASGSASGSGDDKPSGNLSDIEFPFECVDQDGERVGPEGFVPGYTQLYGFADERRNANPIPKTVWFADQDTSTEVLRAKSCKDTKAKAESGGCAKEASSKCTDYDLELRTPLSTREPDPDSKEGEEINEVLWVEWLATGGSFSAGATLLSEAKIKSPADESSKASKELVSKITWLPPKEKGEVRLHAVLRDSRGGSTLQSFKVLVE